MGKKRTIIVASSPRVFLECFVILYTKQKQSRPSDKCVITRDARGQPTVRALM